MSNEKYENLIAALDIGTSKVIATGKQYSVREFILWSASFLGIKINFKGEGLNPMMTSTLDVAVLRAVPSLLQETSSSASTL